MSFLVSAITGFLNEDTQIMRDQAEFDKEQAEKNVFAFKHLKMIREILQKILIQKYMKMKTEVRFPLWKYQRIFSFI